MEFKLFDAHCHLQFPQYKDDLPEVLARMRALAEGAVIIGTDFETSKAGLALAKQHEFLWAAVGLHPNDNLNEEFDAAAYEALALDAKVVAIGECGLDYFRTEGSEDNKAKQRERFKAHAALAQKVGKPLVIHCREAHYDMLALLQELKPRVPVIIHFFTGSAELAQQYLDLGCYLSFPGPVTFTEMYDESMRLCPLDKMLIETDAPFAAPKPYRGKRNEPSFVLEVARKIGLIKGVSGEEIAQYTTATARKVFGV